MLLLAAFSLPAPALLRAQNSQLQLRASGVYVRAFGGGGLGFELSAAAEIPIAAPAARMAFGVGMWHARPDIQTGNPFGDHRRLTGVGGNWQIRFGPLAGRLMPYLTVPIQAVRSAIPDPFVAGPPSPTASTKPIQDRVHEKWTFAIGIEAGSFVQLSSALDFQLGVTVLRQELFEADRTPLLLIRGGLSIGIHSLLSARSD